MPKPLKAISSPGVRLPQYSEIKKKREKEREKRTKQRPVKPQLKGRIRKSIGAKSMRAKVQRSLTRSSNRGVREAVEVKPTIASTDLAHAVLKALAPLGAENTYKGVVVLLKWVLVGVLESFKRQSVSKEDLEELKRRFASVFDPSLAAKPEIAGWLWEWSLQGAGDKVADAARDLVLRISVSDAQFAEKVGLLIKQTVELLADSTEMSSRLVLSMFNGLLVHFLDGSLWGVR